MRDRPRVRPGAKEQGQEAALEDVDETRKRIVALQEPEIALLGRRQRQRALRAEHAQKPGDEAHPSAGLRGRRLERRGGKFHVGILRDDDKFLVERRRIANARLAGIVALEASQRREDVKPPGLGDEVGAEAHETPLNPARGGQRMISPRSLVRTTT